MQWEPAAAVAFTGMITARIGARTNDNHHVRKGPETSPGSRN